MSGSMFTISSIHWLTTSPFFPTQISSGYIGYLLCLCLGKTLPYRASWVPVHDGGTSSLSLSLCHHRIQFQGRRKHSEQPPWNSRTSTRQKDNTVYLIPTYYYLLLLIKVFLDISCIGKWMKLMYVSFPTKHGGDNKHGMYIFYTGE